MNQNFMKYKAVMFDLDGTLLDTLLDLAESMNSVLEKLGFPQHPVDKYRYFVGDGMKMLARRALPQSADEQTVLRCHELMREEYGSRWDKKTRPYDGILELLEELNGRNLILTVFSNKPDDFTRQVVAHFFRPGIFHIVMGAGQFPPKSDPSGALYIAQQCSIETSSFLYVGDTNTDMKTAIGAGMFPVGVTWGFRSREELVNAGAKCTISRPDELLALVTNE